jgi:hypothetical protein
MRVAVNGGSGDVTGCIAAELSGRGPTDADHAQADAFVSVTSPDAVVISRAASNLKERVANSGLNTLVVRTAPVMGSLREVAAILNKRYVEISRNRAEEDLHLGRPLCQAFRRTVARPITLHP